MKLFWVESKRNAKMKNLQYLVRSVRTVYTDYFSLRSKEFCFDLTIRSGIVRAMRHKKFNAQIT